MTGHNGTATIPAAQHAPKGDGAGAVQRIFPALDDRSWLARLLSPSISRLGNALWHQRSVRAQLLITIIVIDSIAALAAGGVTIFQTRNSVQVEVAASMKLADLLVQEAIQTQQYTSAERVLPGFPLQLRFLRHVRISVRDLAGHTVTEHPDSSDSAKDEDRAAPPAWFAALVASPAERHEFPVIANGERLGSVLVTGEPRDEIAEAWEHFAALATVALALNAAVIGILYVLFGRVLDPIARLAGGLSDLERRNYGVRLPPPTVAELAAITYRFNALAQALETTRSENERLNRRLITVQDDERRNIALELHDEVGPCLFGLKAALSSISTVAGTLEDAGRRRVTECTREMLSVIEHMQTMNRGLLNRLRPMALGHVPLKNMLSELVQDRARQHPDIAFSFSGDRLSNSYGDSVDLTIYRCMQESMTNAIKHANAKRVDVDLTEASHEANDDEGADRQRLRQLNLVVHDDGNGFDPAEPIGFGFLGMQERVQALGGKYWVESNIGRGTWVRIAIPIQEQPVASRPRDDETAP
jgi:two-component system sensor histidine kinase UhpB